VIPKIFVLDESDTIYIVLESAADVSPEENFAHYNANTKSFKEKEALIVDVFSIEQHKKSISEKARQRKWKEKYHHIEMITSDHQSHVNKISETISDGNSSDTSNVTDEEVFKEEKEMNEVIEKHSAEVNVSKKSGVIIIPAKAELTMIICILMRRI
jgi:hypothetical protein